MTIPQAIDELRAIAAIHGPHVQLSHGGQPVDYFQFSQGEAAIFLGNKPTKIRGIPVKTTWETIGPQEDFSGL